VVRSVPVTPAPEQAPDMASTTDSTSASEAPPPPPPLVEADISAMLDFPPAPQVEIGDGTIESQPPMPMPAPASAPALAAPPLQPPPPLAPGTSAQIRPALPPALGYATPGVTGRGMLAPRRTGGFLTTALLMIVVGFVQMYGFYISVNGRPSDLQFFIHVAACLSWIGLSVAALVMWLTWLSGVHKDIRVLTAGQYSISPAKASGFFFIPIFNAFWTVFAPAKLAGALNMQLRAAGEAPVSRGAVAMCQIASVITPLVGLHPISPLMYAISMRMIQGGFNRLVKLQYAP
jgi:hypothetical protein